MAAQGEGILQVDGSTPPYVSQVAVTGKYKEINQ